MTFLVNFSTTTCNEAISKNMTAKGRRGQTLELLGGPSSGLGDRVRLRPLLLLLLLYQRPPRLRLGLRLRLRLRDGDLFLKRDPLWWPASRSNAGLRDALFPLKSLRGVTERESDRDRPLADPRWEGIGERRRGGLADMTTWKLRGGRESLGRPEGEVRNVGDD